ncbi:MAG: O-antigen ligase family protein [Flavobacteriales bacterium]|nr:O-antigen ligase family protein [Flavobacteriales bacterium]
MNKEATYSMYVFSVALVMATSAYFVKVNNAAILFMGISWLFASAPKDKWNNLMSNKWIFLPISYFAIHVVSMMLSENSSEAWMQVQKKLSFFILPIFLITGPRLHKKALRSIFLLFGFSIALGALFFLLNALAVFTITGETAHFFYHDLVSAYGIHAVYFSIYCILGIFALLESATDPFFEWEDTYLYKTFLTGVFGIITIVLFLLSSKMALVAYSVLVLFRTAILLKSNFGVGGFSKWAWAALGLFIITGMAIAAPKITHRYQEITQNISAVNQQQFTYDSPLNGLTLRLIIWNQVFEIVEKENAYLMGVGNGDGQDKLNEAYAAIGLYTGNPDLNDMGYLEYNPHNQYVQEYLNTGIIGLAALLMLFVVGTLRAKTLAFLFFATMFVFGLASLSESVLQRQAGVVLFATMLGIILSNSGRANKPLNN